MEQATFGRQLSFPSRFAVAQTATEAQLVSLPMPSNRCDARARSASQIPRQICAQITCMVYILFDYIRYLPRSSDLQAARDTACLHLSAERRPLAAETTQPAPLQNNIASILPFRSTTKPCWPKKQNQNRSTSSRLSSSGGAASSPTSTPRSTLTCSRRSWLCRSSSWASEPGEESSVALLRVLCQIDAYAATGEKALVVSSALTN